MNRPPIGRQPRCSGMSIDCGPEAQQELAGFLNLPQIELHTLGHVARLSLQRLAAKNRKFRRDLSYKLSTLTITLTPLSRRREDIPLLAQHFLEQQNAAGGPAVGRLSACRTGIVGGSVLDRQRRRAGSRGT